MNTISIWILCVVSTIFAHTEPNEDIISLIRSLASKIKSLEQKIDEGMKKEKEIVKRIDSIEKRLGNRTLQGDYAKRIGKLELDMDKTKQSFLKHIPGAQEYKYVTTEVTWHEAEADCIKWGGHLITILSEFENDLFYQAAIKRNLTGESVWIGLTDKSREGKFLWTSGVYSAYRNWDSGEPNGLVGENCVELYLRYHSGNWNDDLCTKKRPYICERKKK